MRRQSVFEIWLRTGRTVHGEVPAVEVKFNPWHDPKNGRFTFAGQGLYSGWGKPSGQTGSSGKREGRGRADAAGASRIPDRELHSPHEKWDPHNPRNYSIHTAKRGDTLTSIAAPGRDSASPTWRG